MTSPDTKMPSFRHSVLVISVILNLRTKFVQDPEIRGKSESSELEASPGFWS